jgi:hypothetical protein
VYGKCVDYAMMDSQYNLHFVYSDQTSDCVGYVRGPTGSQGPPGAQMVNAWVDRCGVIHFLLTDQSVVSCKIGTELPITCIVQAGGGPAGSAPPAPLMNVPTGANVAVGVAPDIITMNNTGVLVADKLKTSFMAYTPGICDVTVSLQLQQQTSNVPVTSGFNLHILVDAQIVHTFADTLSGTVLVPVTRCPSQISLAIENTSSTVPLALTYVYMKGEFVSHNTWPDPGTGPSTAATGPPPAATGP